MRLRALWSRRPACVLAILCAVCTFAFAAQLARADCTVSGIRPIHALAEAAPGTVRVRGVVTAVFAGLGGYFIEAPRASWDDDESTSEGLFVYDGRHLPKLAGGTRIILAGHFQFFHGMPELVHTRILKRCGRAALPPPVVLRLPLVRRGDWRGLLGMRLRFEQALYVSGLDDFVRYGEVLLAAGSRLYAPTARTSPGANAAAFAAAQNARSLWLDDGSTRARPQTLTFAAERFDAGHPLRAGQALEQLTGIAYHAFGRDLIEPTSFALDRKTNPRPTPEGLGLPAGLRVLSFNVENYFNRALVGPAFPTERGARSATELNCQRAKLVAVLAALQPGLAGLEEIENNGYGDDGALANLIAALNRAVAGAPYRYVRPPGSRLGNDVIAPALVYDSRLLAPVGHVAALAAPNAGLALGSKAATGLARPALAATFRVRTSGLRFTAAVVHLRSKLSSCGGALDSNAGAGYCAGARSAAADALTAWLDTHPTGEKTANVFLLGDFNAYSYEAAIKRLQAAGWLDLAAHYLAADKRYTESYRGRVGTLDYIFASPALSRHIAGATIWHNDTDEARGFGYKGAMPACSGAAAPYRASDHDPVIVVLKP
ncbi:MAG: ExeM/NucH family extracellular endonuclease [Gammaproteobacteria bacterium]